MAGVTCARAAGLAVAAVFVVTGLAVLDELAVDPVHAATDAARSATLSAAITLVFRRETASGPVLMIPPLHVEPLRANLRI